MKNLTKNSVANVAKVGVASALIGAGLFFSACDDNSAESLIKKKYPEAKILSFDEAKAELGLIDDRECLTIDETVIGSDRVRRGWVFYPYFIKNKDKIEVVDISVYINAKENQNPKSKAEVNYSVESLKYKKPECFKK